MCGFGSEFWHYVLRVIGRSDYRVSNATYQYHGKSINNVVSQQGNVYKLYHTNDIRNYRLISKLITELINYKLIN